MRVKTPPSHSCIVSCRSPARIRLQELSLLQRCNRLLQMQRCHRTQVRHHELPVAAAACNAATSSSCTAPLEATTLRTPRW